MPLLRPLYLEWPELEEAYRHFHEYYFGDEMLVAPVLQADGQRSVYLPPGSWMDFFTGQPHRGGTTLTGRYATDATPVFVREGSIIPEASVPRGRDRAGRAASVLTLDVYGSGKGHFELYEDDGISLDYERGRYALTPMTYSTSGAEHRLIIGPTHGSFTGQPPRRSYAIRIHAAARPAAILIDGQRAARWHWERRNSTAYLQLPVGSIRRTLTVTW